MMKTRHERQPIVPLNRRLYKKTKRGVMGNGKNECNKANESSGGPCSILKKAREGQKVSPICRETGMACGRVSEVLLSKGNM